LSRRAAGIALLLLCSVLYLPGLTTIPPIDRDEAYFAQATRQMLETGDYVRPRFQDQNRYRKPIGIYWLQAASVAALGQRGRRAIWPYRIPSVVGAALAVLMTWAIGETLCDAETALLAGAILASSMLLTVEALMAKTDAMLLACIVAAQWSLALLYVRYPTVPAPARYAALFWITQGLGILIKGPVAPLVSFLTIAGLALMERFDPASTGGSMIRKLIRDLRLSWGIPLVLLILAPWTIAVGVSTNWSFFSEAAARDIGPKIVTGVESHGGWPGYYFVTALVTFWPASIVAGLAVWHTISHPKTPAARFILAWLVPTWLFFEFLPTKLPHYVMPAFPPLALATARFAVATEPTAAPWRWIRLQGLLWLSATIVLGSALIAAPPFLGGRESTVGLIASMVAFASGWVAFRACRRGDPRGGLWCAVAGAAVLIFVLRSWMIPGLEALWLPSRAAAAVAPTSDPAPVAVVGYDEPSMVFLIGTDTQLTNPASAAQLLKDRPGAVALVNDRQLRDFESAMRSKAVVAVPIWSGSGIDYTKGRAVSMTAFKLSPALR
jgi:4-amino-4-deoxy-L-arabinose transferase-like glycosyltransferase